MAAPTVNDRINSLLALPVTRKVALAIVVGALVIANRKFGLGLEAAELATIAAVFGAAILGIAYEDAAKALPPEKSEKPAPAPAAPAKPE